MPYIGKSPVGGGFHKLDNLTASATATYALTLGGAAYFPETANQLLVSLNGVIQAPQDSFTVSGSNLIFDTALTASDSIDFVVALGDVLGVQGVTDGAVTTNKIANGAVTAAKIDSLPTGSVLQVKQTDLDTFYSNLTNIPLDNTKPQITEGGEILTCSITPTSATSKLLIDVVINAANDTANNISGIFLFQDSNADALRSAWSRTVAANTPMSPMVIKHFMTAGTTSSTTFRVRGGTLGATSTFQVNGGSGVQYLGGSLISSITITEIAG